MILLDHPDGERARSLAGGLAVAITVGMLGLLTFALAASVGLTVLATATWHWW